MVEHEVINELRNMYPSNSLEQKTKPKNVNPNEKRIEKIVNGKVIVRKKSIGRKFADLFLGENVKDIKGYVLKDVIAPTVKNTLWSIFTGSLSMLFWGTANHGMNNPYNTGTKVYYGGNTYTTGNSLYANSNASTQKVASRSSRNVQEILFSNRNEAENVLNHMFELLEEYGAVRLMDYYDAVGYSGDYVNAEWGWRDLRGSDIRPTNEGFIILLPPVINLK